MREEFNLKFDYLCIINLHFMDNLMDIKIYNLCFLQLDEKSDSEFDRRRFVSCFINLRSKVNFLSFNKKKRRIETLSVIDSLTRHWHVHFPYYYLVNMFAHYLSMNHLHYYNYLRFALLMMSFVRMYFQSFFSTI